MRHTATTAALHIVTSLADVAAELQEELNVTSRQLSTSQKQKATQTKIKQLEKKVAEGQRRKEELGKWIDDIFDRYVDNKTGCILCQPSVAGK